MSARRRQRGLGRQPREARRHRCCIPACLKEIRPCPASRSSQAATGGSAAPPPTRFDILVNNAGFDRLTPFGQTTVDVIDALYAVHVRGPVLLTELLAPMVRDGGRILFTSSGLTRYAANPAYSVYAAMKGAVEVYTKYAAKVLGARAITVNALAPGATATDFAGGVIRDDADYRAMVTANHASGRVGEPEDIGNAVRAITAEAASWITAQRIEASGGQSL
jgi:NAD(P)-dependent dehydrogenase (short-subunit alcohol dehydrogenase family)